MAKKSQITLSGSPELFAKVAVETSLDEAVKMHGDAITAGEYYALSTLSKEELKTLVSINQKITGIRRGALEAEAWVCINGIC